MGGGASGPDEPAAPAADASEAPRLGASEAPHLAPPSVTYHVSFLDALRQGRAIGLEIRPGAGGRGHPAGIPAWASPHAAAHGLDLARRGGDAANPGSRRVVERSRDVLDEEREGSVCFRAPAP